LYLDVSGFKPQLYYDWRNDSLRLVGKVYDRRSAR
jgi:hypothetical protein